MAIEQPRFPKFRTRFAWVVVPLSVAAYLLPFWISWPSISRQAGNDFYPLYYVYKVYLLDVMVGQGRIPLWSPAEAAGFPFISNPFAAALYPPNVVLAGFYALMGGYSVHDHQVFTALAIICFAMGIYAWLRALGYGIPSCLLAAIIAGCSLRMTELMRFPNAVHAASWLPWLLVGATWIANGRARLGGLALLCGGILIVTAGYPYYAYYAQFLIPPYVACVAVPSLREAVYWRGHCPSLRPLRFVGITCAWGVGALLITWPYLSMVRPLLQQTVDRGGNSLEYSIEVTWDLTDSLGSWLYPPGASPEGWYYFGCIAVALILVYAVRTVRHGFWRGCEGRFLAILSLWVILVTAIACGRESPVFVWCWEYWPGFSSLRNWGRLSIVMVPLIALLIARAFEDWCKSLRSLSTPSQRSRHLIEIVGVIAVMMSIQLGFIVTGHVDGYWEEHFVPNGWSAPSWWFPLQAVIAGLVLTLVSESVRFGLSPDRAVMIAVPLISWAAMLDVGKVGWLQWTHPSQPADFVRVRPNVAPTYETTFSEKRSFDRRTLSLSSSYSTGIVQNWYFGRYVAFLDAAGLSIRSSPDAERAPQREAALAVLGVTQPSRLYLVESIAWEDAHSFLGDADRVAATSKCSVRVVRYSGDELTCEVVSDRPVYLCFIDNWDPYWRGSVNGIDAPVLTCLGSFKAVHLQAGRSEVVLAYDPGAAGFFSRGSASPSGLREGVPRSTN